MLSGGVICFSVAHDVGPLGGRAGPALLVMAPNIGRCFGPSTPL